MDLYLLIILDGARYDVFRELYSSGELRFLCSETKPEQFRMAISTFPTTTGPAHLPMLTGKPPGMCNIPGIRWFDRHRFAKKFFSFKKYRSYVGFGAYLLDYDIDPNVKTIFSYFKRPAGVFSSLNRGIKFIRRFGYLSRAYLTPYARLNGHWEKADFKVFELIKKAIAGGSDFIHAVFPSIDELSHHSSPFSDMVYEVYIRFDRIMKSIFDFAASISPNIFIKFCILSDHGLTRTYTHLDLDRFIENKIHKKVFYYPKVFKAWTGPEVINMISGNGMSHIYIKGKKGWEHTPDYDEIMGTGIVEALLEREEIEHVIVRKNSNQAHIYSKNGSGEVGLRGNTYYYKPLKGDPLLHSHPVEGSPSEVLKKTQNSIFPDSIYAILQLLQSPRCGDIIVTSKPGYDLRAGHFEIPEHLSSHGSFHRDHILVPFLTNIEYNLPEILRTSESYYLILKDAKKIP